MADDPKKKIKDLNEELGYFEEQVLSIADLLSRTIKDAIDDIRDSSSGVADIFEKRLTKSIKDFAKSSDAVLNNQLKIYQGSIKDRDITKSKNDLELKRLAILRNIEVLKRNGIEVDAESASDLQDAYKRQIVLLEDQVKEAQRIQQSMGITGNIIKGISKIPILGNFLDAEEALSAAQLSAAKSGSSRAKVMGAAFKQLGSTLKTSLTDPIVLLGITIKLFKELVNMGLAFSQRTAEIARNLGISSSEAQILNQRFSDITASSNNLLSTQTNLLEATNQINDRFGTSAMLTESMLEDQIDLTKKLGLSGEEAAAFAEYSLLSGQSQEDIVNAIGKQNKGLLNNKKVIQAVAKVGGQLNAQYKGNPELIAKAVVQAQKLGMTLEDTQGIAKSLLNFEESIANELSAELITGMDLNLEKARYLALQGKSAEAAAELMKNLGPNGLNKFQNMNVIQQEALAGALGMSADQLADSLKTQQALNKLSTTDRRAYKDAIKAAQEKGDYDKAAALEKQMNQGKEFELAKVNLDAQQKFNAAVDKLKGLLASIVEGPLGQMAETIANMIAGIAKIPGVKEILGYAAPIAAVLTGGMLIKSLTKGTSMNPMVVTIAGGGGGALGGGGAGGSRPTGLGRVARAFNRGGMRGGGKAIGRMLKSSVKGVGGKLGALGALASLGMDISEGGLNMESIGRAGLTGLGSIAGGALGSIIAPGVGTIAGGVGGGMAGDKLGNLIFGERVELAAGGIVTKPTRALVGEAGPEAVVPLSQLMNEFAEMKRYLAQIATKEGTIYMGPTKVGTAVTVGTYKTQ